MCREETQMPNRSRSKPILYAVVVAGMTACFCRVSRCADQAASPAPQVFLDKSPKIVQFQLKRLTNPQLLAVERKTDHAKYIPVYDAILVRKDIERKYRQE